MRRTSMRRAIFLTVTLVLACTPTGDADAPSPAGAIDPRPDDDSSPEPAEAEVNEAKIAEEPASEPPTTDPPTTAPPAPVSPPTSPPLSDIAPLYAGDEDSARAIPAYIGRDRGKSEEPKGLLSAITLVGASVHERPDSTSPAIATLTDKELLTPTGDSCPWVHLQPEFKWTDGHLRCGDVLLREEDYGGYGVPVFESIDVGGVAWHRILATNKGDTGWVRAEPKPMQFTTPMRRYAGVATPYWDLMVSDKPGGTATAVVYKGNIAIHVDKVRRLRNATWLKVRVNVDQCLDDSDRALGEGWIPLRDDKGRLNVFYEISC